jgi:hypothetical protein
MADISPPHIESIGDPGTGTREQPSSQRRAKATAAGKSAAPREPLKTVPKIGPAEEDEHKIDELA